MTGTPLHLSATTLALATLIGLSATAEAALTTPLERWSSIEVIMEETFHYPSLPVCDPDCRYQSFSASGSKSTDSLTAEFNETLNVSDTDAGYTLSAFVRQHSAISDNLITNSIGAEVPKIYKPYSRTSYFTNEFSYTFRLNHPAVVNFKGNTGVFILDPTGNAGMYLVDEIGNWIERGRSIDFTGVLQPGVYTLHHGMTGHSSGGGKLVFELTPTPVALPAALPLFLAGVGALAAAARRIAASSISEPNA